MTLHLSAPQTFLTSLVGVAPPRARHVSSDQVLQRLTYVPGRTLTETAIETEQAWVEARLGIAGRRLAPGIVSGLAVGVADQDAAPGAFRIGSGRGIVTGGQDVSVLKPADLVASNLPDLSLQGQVGDPPQGLVVLMLQPIVVERERLPQTVSRAFAFADPCPPDATAAPYLDFVLQDAVRVGYLPLDLGLGAVAAERAPNLVAEAIRQQEADAEDSLAWRDLGLPIAVFFIDAEGRIQWQHRAAVARRGGGLPMAGLGRGDALRQSRLEGLIEETAMATERSAWDGVNGAAFLRHMPPAGVLPSKCWKKSGFFPGDWGIAQAPIPVSQLDAALEAARRLAPYDLDIDVDQVKFLVPVSDALYDPELLEPVTIPRFSSVIKPLEARVGTARSLRNAYREQAKVVQGVLDITAVSDFTLAEEDPISGEEDFETDPHGFEAFAAQALDVIEQVHKGLSPVLFTEAQRRIVEPARMQNAEPVDGPLGLTPFVDEMRGLIDRGNDTVDFAFIRVQAEIYRLRQIMLDNEEATKLATFPVLAGLAKGTNDFAMAEGLRAHFLAQKGDFIGVTAATPTDGSGSGRSIAPASTPPVMPTVGPLFGNLAGMPSRTLERRGRFERIERLPGGPAVALPEESPISVGGLMGSTLISGFGTNSASLSFGASLSETAFYTASNATLVKDLVDNTRAELVDDAVLSSTTAKRTGILKAAPLPGDIRDIRTASIADRLKASASINAKASAVRIKADILRQLQDMGLSLVGLRAPISSARDRVILPKAEVEKAISETLTDVEQDRFNEHLRRVRGSISDTGEEEWEVVRLDVPQGDTNAFAVSPIARLNMTLLRLHAPFDLSLLPILALNKQLDPDPGKGELDDDTVDDESAYLSSAVATLESAIALLRVVEARILAISEAVEGVASRIPVLAKNQAAWQVALELADQDLDEARHDQRVARSLIDEEKERLGKLAAHRAKILDEIRFVAYTRPRGLLPHRQGDTLGLMLPGKFEDPLPSTLRKDVDLPEELEAMIEALREMPIGWFTANPELAAQFKSPRYLDHLFSGIRTRAVARQTQALPVAAPQPQRGGPAFQQVQRVSSAYRAMTLKLMDARARLDLGTLSRQSWTERRRSALALLSLNDLIEGSKQPAVARRAVWEIEQIERVIHAIWQLARDVRPAIRLLWAQSLSEFDTVTSLSRLSGLPAWEQVGFATRAKLERLNGWLFSRVEPGIPEAQALMTDLVRVALLISAHAPVAEIIAARLEEDQAVQPGGGVDIMIRRGHPKIGMRVAFDIGGQLSARGEVVDLHGTRARVQLAYTERPILTLTAAHQVTLYSVAAMTKSGD